ncbi:MAG: YicC family protein [Gammaproteobacteria bacterium]|nr:YicC family protein [Gammaproteobacteria bacterium]
MIASMTGFARREATGPWGSLTCELRSVNHRFLEPGFRLPEDLRAAESGLRQALGRELKRGKIDCTVHLRPAQGAERSLDIDREALDRLLARVREVAAALPEGRSIDAVELLRWPGVIREERTDIESLTATLHTLFAETLRELAAARAREGERLKALIEERCSQLETLVAQVRTRLPEVQARLRARLEERLAEITLDFNRDRLEQELALVLQRIDVAEELDRLTGHIEETRRVISGKEPAGRRLDFLMQELNREANTLSSKSQDLESTRIALDMKVVVEQMREQVQNIE